MQMSKEEFVETIMRLARQERQMKELAEKERQRRIRYELNDYIITTAGKMRWDRNYRRSRNPRRRKWDFINE